jgi:hypothetical protein
MKQSKRAQLNCDMNETTLVCKPVHLQRPTLLSNSLCENIHLPLLFDALGEHLCFAFRVFANSNHIVARGRAGYRLLDNMW